MNVVKTEFIFMSLILYLNLLINIDYAVCTGNLVLSQLMQKEIIELSMGLREGINIGRTNSIIQINNV